jgi:hypothetical protein
MDSLRRFPLVIALIIRVVPEQIYREVQGTFRAKIETLCAELSPF